MGGFCCWVTKADMLRCMYEYIGDRLLFWLEVYVDAPDSVCVLPRWWCEAVSLIRSRCTSVHS